MSVKHLSMCLFFTAFLSLVPSNGATNLLTNPGFESGTTDGWFAPGCAISTSTSQKHSGSYSGLVSGRTDWWHGVQQDIQGLIDHGDSCTISGWIRLENAPEDFVMFLIEQTDDSGTNYHFINWAMCYDDMWTYLLGDFILNVNGTLSGLNLYIGGPDPGVNFYLDDVELIGPDLDPNHAIGQVNANTIYQEIEGFGAAGAWYENYLLYHQKKEELYDLLFGDLGLDIYRVRNTYDQGSSGADYMSRSGQIVTAAKQRNPNLKIMTSSWSPPAYLKSNNSTVSGTLIKDANGNYKYEEFAKWWADSLDELSSYGIDVDYVNMQNEPDYLASWDSCKFTPTETTNYAGYNLAFEALYNELNSRPNCPKLLAPEAVGMYNSADYIDALIDDSHVYGYAHHLYGDGSHQQPDGYISTMVNFSSRYGHKPLLQTEFAKGESSRPTFNDAMNLAILMHNSLTFEGASSYIYWELFWKNPKGFISLDSPRVSNPRYTINPVYYTFKQYCAFVHSGWKRVDASTDSYNQKISAYLSPDNEQLTVVLINTYRLTDVELDLDFNNFYVEDGNVYRTSREENCVLVGSFDPVNPLTLPSKSITTLALYGRVTTPPVADAGPNQVAYVGINRYADVTLDGSGSYDDDGDSLNYYWYWSIDGNDHEANSVSPTISLPVGEHLIELIVDDGYFFSEPDHCTVNVIAPLQTKIFCMPRTLNRKSRGGQLIALISMPSDIRKTDVNCVEPLIFYPGRIESQNHSVFESNRYGQSGSYIRALFDKSECTEYLEPGINEVNVTGKLTSGRYYNATDNLRLAPMKRNERP